MEQAMTQSSDSIPNRYEVAPDQEITLGALRAIRQQQLAANEQPRLNFCLATQEQVERALALPNFVKREWYRNTKPLHDTEIGAVEVFRLFAPAAEA